MMIGEMEVTHEENQIEENLLEITASEFSERMWSVVTYESVAVGNLTYSEALDWIKKLDDQNISGLCIVTDAAAAKIAQS